MPVLLAALGMLAVSLDSAVNVALPDMAAAFGVGPAAIRWVIICYVLTYALTAFAAGLAADRVGAGPVEPSSAPPIGGYFGSRCRTSCAVVVAPSSTVKLVSAGR